MNLGEHLPADFEGSNEKGLSSLLLEANEAVAYMDADWVMRYCNDVYLSNVGLARECVIGHRPSAYIANFERSIFFRDIAICKAERRPVSTIGFSVPMNRWLLARYFPCKGGGTLVLANDASESIVKQYQLAQQALKDTLTGLPNKLALTQAMETCLEAQVPFWVTVLGLNRFRTVNDTLGFATGDRFLTQMASVLQSATDDCERLFRFAGDEYAVLSTGPASDIDGRVKALLLTTALPLRLDRQSFELGAAAGVAIADSDEFDVEVLLKRAALALHQAKHSGRTEYRVYEEGMEAASRRRLAMEGELRSAVNAGEFALMLQPKGCLQQRRVLGAEGLIRWFHPTRGMVSPADFLPLAQECGLMVEIDRWVLKTALSMIVSLQDMGLAMPVSINLSVDSLSDPALVDNVRTALEEAGVSARMLEIEIPEGAMMRDVQVSGRVLGELHALGVRVSIDDFGTGYSSFAYLTRFPVQTLKIDRSFVHDMSKSVASRNVVKGLIRLAHSLNMRVVAEGAETDEQIDALSRMDCDEVQGFGYARPMPFLQFVAFIRAHLPSGPVISAFSV